VKALLRSGILTEDGQAQETIAGTPQGGIRSPLLANVALSVLDGLFVEHWQRNSGTTYQRTKRRRAGLPNDRIVRYADDFVVLVSGVRRTRRPCEKRSPRSSPRWACACRTRRRRSRRRGLRFSGLPHPAEAQARHR
jgi:hypothetical protein